MPAGWERRVSRTRRDGPLPLYALPQPVPGPSTRRPTVSFLPYLDARASDGTLALLQLIFALRPLLPFGRRRPPSPSRAARSAGTLPRRSPARPGQSEFATHSTREPLSSASTSLPATPRSCRRLTRRRIVRARHAAAAARRRWRSGEGRHGQDAGARHHRDRGGGVSASALRGPRIWSTRADM